MKIKFPILIRYPKQLRSLLEYLDSKGIRWVSGRNLLDATIVPSSKCPYWIFYEKCCDNLWREYGDCLSYWKVEDESELDLDNVLIQSGCECCEVDFED